LPPQSPRSLSRHELIGLLVAVESDCCAAYAGITGQVVDETKNLLVVSDGRRRRRIPKGAAAFRFTLHDHSTCLLEGKTILGRPEDRVKKGRGT
jgi:ribonuclease P protein subunit POP4